MPDELRDERSQSGREPPSVREPIEDHGPPEAVESPPLSPEDQSRGPDEQDPPPPPDGPPDAPPPEAGVGWQDPPPSDGVGSQDTPSSDDSEPDATTADAPPPPEPPVPHEPPPEGTPATVQKPEESTAAEEAGPPDAPPPPAPPAEELPPRPGREQVGTGSHLDPVEAQEKGGTTAADSRRAELTPPPPAAPEVVQVGNPSAGSAPERPPSDPMAADGTDQDQDDRFRWRPLDRPEEPLTSDRYPFLRPADQVTREAQAVPGPAATQAGTRGEQPAAGRAPGERQLENFTGDVS